MKKFILIVACLVPVLSFASNVQHSKPLDVYQEQCAKEKDPVKRGNYCNMLDRFGKSQEAYIPDEHKETVTV